MQSIGYKPLTKDYLASILLDEICLKTKQNVDTFLVVYDGINIVSDESNNQMGDKILNLTVMTKDHEFFHAYSQSTSAIKLTANATATYIPRKNLPAHQIRLQKSQ